MDTNNYKILKYSLDQDEISDLCNFDYDENCPFCCCDIYISYLELYKKITATNVSTCNTKCFCLIKDFLVFNYSINY